MIASGPGPLRVELRQLPTEQHMRLVVHAVVRSKGFTLPD
jgi:hypothetical protein